jgi:hypothetical protein
MSGDRPRVGLCSKCMLPGCAGALLFDVKCCCEEGVEVGTALIVN